MANLLSNRYQVLKPLKESRSGQTVLAEDTQSPTRQRCVVKQLNAVAYSPEQVQQLQAKFSQEADRLKAVSQGHAQIPDLYGYFTEQGLFYWVREWIAGRPIKDFAASPWTEKQVKAFLRSALGALAHLHSQSVAHLSLNPGNIIVRQADNHPCLAGVGNKALIAIANPKNIMVRTSGFTAPEQTMGTPSMASDIYSLGMVAIRLLTAMAPLKIPTDKNNGRLLWQQFAPEVSDRLAGVLTRAVHTSPTIRFANAAEMRSVLQQSAPAQATTPASAKPPKPALVSPTVVTPKPAVSASTPANPIYNPTAAGVPLFKRAFFKWWVGILVGSLGVGALILFGESGFSRSTTADVSSPEILAETVKTLEEKLESNPNNEKASLELVEAYLYGGNVEAADEIIDGLLDEDDTNANALYQQGRLQFYQSDYTGAIDSLEDSVEQDGRHGKAVVMLGRAYQEIGDYDSAKEQFESALALAGQRGEAHLNLSYLNHLQGETQAALDEVNAAARFFKGDERLKVHTQRGTLYFDLRERDRAVTEWESAIALSPRNPEAYVLQSISKFFLGDSEGALANLDQAIAINPNFTEAYAMESLIHLNQGDLEASIDAIDAAVTIDEFSVSTLKIIADVALSAPEPRLEFALSAMDQALSINPNNPYILNQRCSFMLAVQEIDTAIENCTRSIEVNPSNVEAYNSRGQAHLAQFDFVSAEADFTRIIEVNEDVGRTPDAAAYAQRAAARAGLEDTEGAKADLDKALEINSEE